MDAKEALELPDDSLQGQYRRTVGPGLLDRIAQAQLARGAQPEPTGAQAAADTKDQPGTT